MAGNRILDDQKLLTVNLVDDKELLAGNSEGSGKPLPVLADLLRGVSLPGADVEGGIGTAAHTPDTRAKPVQDTGDLQKFFTLQDRYWVFPDQFQHNPWGQKAYGVRLMVKTVSYLLLSCLKPLALCLSPIP
jgi:hypothetical protein